ncbi:hypothetical protein A0H76_2416 [Hepatospora eriocheir]|uniref:Uncharacterized protein n=1 Tax=Hepatospora eriocheir TaxID=1081669 RepID=A0A1X0QFG4_9MICR|nr:hypothetical protein A0H76_2416 [Hepatospora eriocheir]
MKYEKCFIKYTYSDIKHFKEVKSVYYQPIKWTFVAVIKLISLIIKKLCNQKMSYKNNFLRLYYSFQQLN